MKMGDVERLAHRRVGGMKPHAVVRVRLLKLVPWCRLGNLLLNLLHKRGLSQSREHLQQLVP